MRDRKRITALLLCLLLLAGTVPVSAEASHSRNPSETVTVTLRCFDGSRPLAGAVFKLWLVATLNDEGKPVVTDTFAEYITRSQLNSGRWVDAARNLELTVIRNAISPTDSGTVDANGNLVFPTGGKQLPQGIYLIAGDILKLDSVFYTPASALISVPTLLNGSWTYDLILTPKFDKNKIDDTLNRRVIKVWKDSGHTRKRPASIMVYLLRNGAIYDEQKLSKDNGWSYEWTGLPAGYRWSIAEEELSGYTSASVVDGEVTTITNTYNPPGMPPEGSGDRLPQTGQLRWPVPALLCAGTLFLLAGLIHRKKSDS